MAKIEECDYMMLYEVAYCDVELVGSRIAYYLYLKNPTTSEINKRISIAISNVPNFFKASGIKSGSSLICSYIRCLINKYDEINYVSFTEDNWVVCKEVFFPGE